MGQIAIEARGLSKRYRIGQRQAFRTLRETLVDTARRPFLRLRDAVRGAPQDEGQEGWIWALHDLDLTVQHGEVLGIIGRNGAGKSTLLKLFSRITTPDAGYADIYGRVGSLLEVGTGFHPELTGRENIYLNGAILGMHKSEIEGKFDEIVDFSEIGPFLDTPVKRYSSGMYMRLAFSVAAHLEPEILIVDEVLAVGDAAFQKKCLGKMGGVAKEGRTVLFVSHNLMAMQGLCTRMIRLEQGRLVDEGTPDRVVSSYLQSTIITQTEHVWEDLSDAPGTPEVRLRRACVRPQNGVSQEPIDVTTPFVVELEYEVLREGAVLNLDLRLFNEQGILVFEAGPDNRGEWLGRPLPAGLYRDACRVPGNLLNNGMYRAGIHIVKNQGALVFKDDDLLTFDVQDSLEDRGGWYGNWAGVVRPAVEWQTDFLEPALAGERRERRRQ